jgi:thiosulfate/3-mercaptopyruvate sulfurtransferase
MTPGKRGNPGATGALHRIRWPGDRTRQVGGRLSVTLTACLVLSARPVQATTSIQLPEPVQDEPGVLVSVDWLADHLQDPSLVLLHVGMPTAESSAEFIPGARFLSFQDIVRVRGGLIVEMPAAAELVEPFSVAGVSGETFVVLYGSPAHLPARAYVALDYLGHGAHAAVLDGGLEAWKAAGHPVDATPTRGPRGVLNPSVRSDVLVTTDWVEQRLDDPGITLIDSRPAGEYSGDVPARIGGRAGHIPGARNLYWEDLLVAPENPVLLDFQDVLDRFQDAGAYAGATVVNYCWVGMRASYTYLIAKHLGYDARLYDGSWNAWSKDDSLPGVTGPFPR